jgi:hypothetical protein
MNDEQHSGIDLHILARLSFEEDAVAIAQSLRGEQGRGLHLKPVDARLQPRPDDKSLAEMLVRIKPPRHPCHSDGCANTFSIPIHRSDHIFTRINPRMMPSA